MDITPEVLFEVFAFLLLIGTPIGAALSLYSDYKDTKAQAKSDLEWLSIEMDKPKFCIRFYDMHGKVHKTDPFPPYNVSEGSQFNMRITSEQAAKRFLEICYERGYFQNNSNVTFPVSQISKAKIDLWV